VRCGLPYRDKEPENPATLSSKNLKIAKDWIIGIFDEL
jgi:hypothetical protein